MFIGDLLEAWRKGEGEEIEGEGRPGRVGLWRGIRLLTGARARGRKFWEEKEGRKEKKKKKKETRIKKRDKCFCLDLGV